LKAKKKNKNKKPSSPFAIRGAKLKNYLV